MQAKRSLDIDSSSGEFVYLLHSLGFQAKGIETQSGYKIYARAITSWTTHTQMA
jgi:hypothetical protein